MAFTALLLKFVGLVDVCATSCMHVKRKELCGAKAQSIALTSHNDGSAAVSSVGYFAFDLRLVPAAVRLSPADVAIFLVVSTTCCEALVATSLIARPTWTAVSLPYCIVSSADSPHVFSTPAADLISLPADVSELPTDAAASLATVDLGVSVSGVDMVDVDSNVCICVCVCVCQ